MPKPTDIQIRNVTVETERIEYRSPIKFGGRVVTDAVLLNVTVEVETADGRRGSGFGSMPMGNVWAWPSSVVSAPQSLEAMLQFALAAAEAARDHLEIGHPLDLTRQLAAEHPALAAAIEKKLHLAEPLPKLAELVAQGTLRMTAEGKVLTDQAVIRRGLAETVDQQLPRLARAALLMA